MPGNPYPNAPPPQAYSQIKQHGKGWIIVSILSTVLLLAALVFGVWAFSERQDYKNNVDQKIVTAVELAQEELASVKDAEFAEKEKSPLTSYSGPAAFGSVGIKYPKTWSAYVEESGRNSTPLSGFFHPNFVPGTSSEATYALRLEIVETDYSDELKKFDSAVKSGEVKVSPYVVKAVPGSKGARIDGEIDNDVRGSMVLMPVRDKTLKIWTENEQFKKDFDTIILSNLTFTP